MQEAMPKAKKLNHEEHEETRRKELAISLA